MVTEIDLSEVDESIREKVKEFLTEIGVTLVNNAKEEAPVRSGELRQSIQILEQGDDSLLIGTRKKYAAPVEFGTKPHYPPIEPLKKWVRRKLNIEESVAYAVQQKIGAEGTEPNPFMQRAVDRTREEYK